MSSRTPIRLTPHRGPLATPTASPGSSPTSSTPPSDIIQSHSSVSSASSDLDVAMLQHKISTLPARHHSLSRLLFLWRRDIAERRSYSHCAYMRDALVIEDLICSAIELARGLAGIVTVCLMVWGVLELSTYASEQPQQPNPWMSISGFPLPPPTRILRCRTYPSLCEPRDRQGAVLQFLMEQIEHAKAMSSLSGSLGLPLRAFLEAHQSTNVTELLDPPLLDFTSSGFIGESFSLGLDELDDLISECAISSPYGKRRDARLHAIYWRTVSNLLLEYSAVRPRARRLLDRVRALRDEQLSQSMQRSSAAENIESRATMWWWIRVVCHPATTPVGGGMQALKGLDTTCENLEKLIAYLDWVTEYLSRTTLRDVLNTRHRTDFSSCMGLLQELFAQSKSFPFKKSCFGRHGCEITLPTRLKRVDILVPGSRSVRAGR